MRVKPILLLLAFALGSGFAGPVGASPEKICRTPKELCDNRCTQIMEIEAAFCSMHGFTPMAAICHSANMMQYGGCLAQCQQDWGSGSHMNQVE
jgi:hypothetical protein